MRRATITFHFRIARRWRPRAGRACGALLLVAALAAPVLAARMAAQYKGQSLDEGARQGGTEVRPRRPARQRRGPVADDAVAGTLRILLTDVEVGPAAGINGIAFLPVTGDAREGKVRGILMVMKPDDPNHGLRHPAGAAFGPRRLACSP